MGIAITFRHLASSDAIKGYIHDKLERVQKYLREPLDAHVTVFTERHEHVVEVTLTSSGRHYQARHGSDDMYKSIDQVIDKVEGQIAKHHDAVNRTKKGADNARAVAAFAAATTPATPGATSSHLAAPEDGE
ncbi:MAG: ribosome-associated translation inhibitor RaiA [Deltaproteobacteria bacterium]|nr:ribosome-associated translation inhibitor RaiA [Deltaproteobacteria bacterium]